MKALSNFMKAENNLMKAVCHFRESESYVMKAESHFRGGFCPLMIPERIKQEP
jgi:hypothetical protein